MCCGRHVHHNGRPGQTPQQLAELRRRVSWWTWVTRILRAEILRSRPPPQSPRSGHIPQQLADHQDECHDEHGWRGSCKQRRSDFDRLHYFLWCQLAKRWILPLRHDRDVDNVIDALPLPEPQRFSTQSGPSAPVIAQQRVCQQPYPRTAPVESPRASGHLCQQPCPRSATVQSPRGLCTVMTMGTCRWTTTGMSTTLSKICTCGISTGFRTVCPVNGTVAVGNTVAATWCCGNWGCANNGACWSHVLDNGRGMCIRDRGCKRPTLRGCTCSTANGGASKTCAGSHHCLHPERCLREQEALHHHCCTRAQSFHSEHDHWRIAGGQIRLDVFSEQLSVILSCSHQTWTLLRPTMSALASTQRSSQTGEKACGTWRSQGSGTSTKHSTKSEAFCSETMMSLGVRERMARKPVLRSACRVSSVTARRRWEFCRTTFVNTTPNPRVALPHTIFSRVVKIWVMESTGTFVSRTTRILTSSTTCLTRLRCRFRLTRALPHLHRSNLHHCSLHMEMTTATIYIKMCLSAPWLILTGLQVMRPTILLKWTPLHWSNRCSFTDRVWHRLVILLRALQRILDMLASPLYLQEREASADRSSLSFLQRKLSVNFISLPSEFGETCRSVLTQKEVESRITTFSQRRYFFGTPSISRRKWKLLQYFRFSLLRVDDLLASSAGLAAFPVQRIWIEFHSRISIISSFQSFGNGLCKSWIWRISKRAGQASRRVGATRKVLRETHIRSIHEVEEMKRAQEVRIDEFFRNEFLECQATIQKLSSPIQELQENGLYERFYRISRCKFDLQSTGSYSKSLWDAESRP